MSDLNGSTIIRNSEKIAFTEERKILASLISSTFSVLDPSRILRKHAIEIMEKKEPGGKLYVIGFGKASLKMYEGLREATAHRSTYAGIIIPRGEEVEVDYPELEILRGDHPIAGENTRISSQKLMDRIKDRAEDDMFIVLISGGGSALFEIPENGLTVDEIGETAKCLMNSGADIKELNMVRHSMSKVKGGKLAQILFPAEVYSFIISDVPGDDPQLIASGPLTPISYGGKELQEVVSKYEQYCSILKRHKLMAIPPDSGPEVFRNVHTEIILKNSDFVGQFASGLKKAGANVCTVTEPVTGDVEGVAESLASEARANFAKKEKPVWVIGGGETTVHVQGKGIGGRNCELSLRVLLQMKDDERFLFSSIGTDGIDGVSPAMGGITDTWFRDTVPIEEIMKSLDGSDSYSLLNRYNSAIHTGYTGTNVSDIFIMHYEKKTKGE